MQYKYLLSVFALTTMASTATAAVLDKRSCASYGRQFCCAVEQVPDKEILPNLYLFLYGIGCTEISDKATCDPSSSQPHGICCTASDTQTGPFGSVFCFTHHA